ncbi:hypothetical protein [Priestia megaterium]|uniref:hypothetical protein n=1 Tax=Priestia megaterium TaxID=1404 RepID=UPI003CC5B152
MFSDFQKTFHPTEEEKQQQRDFLKRMIEEQILEFMEQGLTREEAEAKYNQQAEELNNKNRFIIESGSKYKIKAEYLLTETYDRYIIEGIFVLNGDTEKFDFEDSHREKIRLAIEQALKNHWIQKPLEDVEVLAVSKYEEPKVLAEITI